MAEALSGEEESTALATFKGPITLEGDVRLAEVVKAATGAVDAVITATVRAARTMLEIRRLKNIVCCENGSEKEEIPEVSNFERV